MINNLELNGSSSLHEFYAEAFRTFERKRDVPEIDVRFYPYIGINHTIRVRDGKVFVRIAELCRDMPPVGQQALAFILVAKLLRKKVPMNAREIYSNLIKTVEMREKATENKRSRGRKVISTDKGAVYDLGEIFDLLNRDYFRGRVPKPVLTWSARKTYRILGHHDATHKTIVISKSLDSANVPKYVVESVVFHEMLHIHHPTVHHNGRRYNHTAAFRRDEEKFAYFQEAERWIEQNVRKLKKEAKRK
ncbi:MAG: SprT-like domain-containing protein [Pyrinomonadaceae bacterium]